jgi:hypothetical protein
MSSSAIIMAAMGVAISFLPQEILGYFGASGTGVPLLFMQILGALYLGFAILNWTAKEILIGGIYGRPVALGNFMHFAVAALALFRGALSASNPVIWAATAVYSIFAIAFGFVLFGNPIKSSQEK